MFIMNKLVTKIYLFLEILQHCTSSICKTNKWHNTFCVTETIGAKAVFWKYGSTNRAIRPAIHISCNNSLLPSTGQHYQLWSTAVVSWQLQAPINNCIIIIQQVHCHS